MTMYTSERQEEIILKFRELLKDADNFPRDKDPRDYRPFWTGLRLEGSNLLGLCNHLSDQLNAAAGVITELQKEEKKEGEKNEV